MPTERRPLERKTLEIIEAIKGCYGQRIYIPLLNKNLIQLFDSISLWRQGSRGDEVENTEILFELPVGEDIRDNPLILRKIWLEGYKVSGSDYKWDN